MIYNEEPGAHRRLQRHHQPGEPVPQLRHRGLREDFRPVQEAGQMSSYDALAASYDALTVDVWNTAGGQTT